MKLSIAIQGRKWVYSVLQKEVFKDFNLFHFLALCLLNKSMIAVFLKYVLYSSNVKIVI